MPTRPKAPLAAVAGYVVAGLAATGGFYTLVFALSTGGPSGVFGLPVGLGALVVGLMMWVLGRVCADVSAITDVARRVERSGDN